MARKKRLLFLTLLTILLISLIAGCAAPATTTQAPTSSVPVTTTAAPITTESADPAKPQGKLVVGITTFGNENWLPWLDPSMANLDNLVYDMLIYWDHKNFKFLPGLAESWKTSPDGLTLTYHLRKGIQFSDGWGELTSADVKYNFEMQASKESVGKVAQTRRIENMDTPDPYTLIVHFKDPYPTFWVDMSAGNSATCQGFVCKKYIDTVGADTASQKPIGTGPYKVIDNHLGDYYKFEALDHNWRIIPEFKTLTVRLIPETSTLTASLKNKEIDLAQVPAQQLADLKAAGLAVELSANGGTVLNVGLGGMIISVDKRYDEAYHQKEPWTDTRVRKAMAIAIDRQAITKAIYNGYAEPMGVPVIGPGMDKYVYPYDPTAAKQLLKEAGYPNGFSFRAISYVTAGLPEVPRIIEALAGYWQQIGLDPKITAIDYNTYNLKNIASGKTAGDVFIIALAPVADELSRVELMMIPNVSQPIYEDEDSYTIYQALSKNANIEERAACAAKLNQYYFDNVGPIPVIRAGRCYAWNSDKILPWPHPDSNNPQYYEYIRHAQPLNTFRLFNPWPDR